MRVHCWRLGPATGNWTPCQRATEETPSKRISSRVFRRTARHVPQVMTTRANLPRPGPRYRLRAEIRDPDDALEVTLPITRATAGVDSMAQCGISIDVGKPTLYAAISDPTRTGRGHRHMERPTFSHHPGATRGWRKRLPGRPCPRRNRLRGPCDGSHRGCDFCERYGTYFLVSGRAGALGHPGWQSERAGEASSQRGPTEPTSIVRRPGGRGSRPITHLVGLGDRGCLGFPDRSRGERHSPGTVEALRRTSILGR